VCLQGLDLFLLGLLNLFMLQLSLQEGQVLATVLGLAVLHSLSLLHILRLDRISKPSLWRAWQGSRGLRMQE
jgi:hypothetical protein